MAFNIYTKRERKLLLTIFSIFLMIVFSSFLVNSRPLDCNADNPIALWHFDEGTGTTATDSCQGISGILYGTNKTWINGKYGKSISFNGFDNYVDLGSQISQGFNDFSIYAWVKVNEINTDYQAFVGREIAWGDYYWNFALVKDSIVQGYPDSSFFSIFDGNQYVLGTYFHPEFNIVDDGHWHLLIGTFNATEQNMSFYFDGNMVDSMQTASSSIVPSINYFLFGAGFRSDIWNYGYFLNGSLDDVAIFNRTLSQEEITNYYDNIPSNFTCYNNLSEQLIVPSYPYADLNVNYPMQYFFYQNGTIPSYIGDVKIDIKEPNGNNDTFDLNWNYETNGYDLTLLFSQIGNYPFTIYPFFCSNVINSTGTFLVRQPYYINVQLYDDKTLNNIVNNFGYVLAQPVNVKKTNSILESYIYPFTWNKGSAFHAQYLNGNAQLKLWEREDYAIRFLTGDIHFSGTYSPPNITKSYGINSYLGTYAGNGTNITLQYVVSEKELHQYRYLANWCFIIGLVLVLFVAGMLFFMFPEIPLMSFIFGMLFTIILTGLRIVIWFWKGY